MLTVQTAAGFGFPVPPHSPASGALTHGHPCLSLLLRAQPGSTIGVKAIQVLLSIPVERGLSGRRDPSERGRPTPHPPWPDD